MSGHGRIGVDLGGTKIEAVALVDGEIAARHRVPTPQGDYDGTVEAIRGLVEQVAAASGVDSDTPVGIGTPGSVHRGSGLHRNSNSTCLNGRPFEADLARAIPRRVRTANDANCFALSEAVDGAAAGHEVVFGVILGTGVGGGVVVGGRVVEGRNGVGGEWGHKSMPLRGQDPAHAGRSCYCGRTECLEQYLSGPALEAEYERAAGRRRSLAEIAAGAATDPVAAEVLDRFHDRLAECLVTVVDILDPDAIVLGGGVSNLDSIYDTVPGLLHPRVFGGVCDTPVLRHRHGDSSGVRGAAWLWPAR
ncbi:MAG: ROK family protein [Planctomycetota bacterium]|nr:ROK family protein [Planctomycetota bacterium]MEE2894923.1 ROK family protein [Planctomycetota bacterium]